LSPALIRWRIIVRKLGGIALCALPVVAGWLMLSAALGRTQERRAATAHGDWR
jgi:AAA family ATP:ADP antiporter